MHYLNQKVYATNNFRPHPRTNVIQSNFKDQFYTKDEYMHHRQTTMNVINRSVRQRLRGRDGIASTLSLLSTRYDKQIPQVQQSLYNLRKSGHPPNYIYI